MPIRPEMKSRYPADWILIRGRILARAGNACECVGQCGDEHVQEAPNGVLRCNAPNGARIMRRLDLPGWWMLESDTGDGEADLDHYARPIRVVLTIAHLIDKAPEAYEETNFAALCQRCHLRLDLRDHAETAKATREAKSGQGRLPL